MTSDSYVDVVDSNTLLAVPKHLDYSSYLSVNACAVHLKPVEWYSIELDIGHWPLFHGSVKDFPQPITLRTIHIHKIQSSSNTKLRTKAPDKPCKPVNLNRYTLRLYNRVYCAIVRFCIRSPGVIGRAATTAFVEHVKRRAVFHVYVVRGLEI